MNKLQLGNLNSNSRFNIVCRQQQRSIRRGDKFDDGKLGSSEKEFISIVTRAVNTDPETFGPKFNGPEWNKKIEEKYPDIYRSFVSS